MRWTAWLAACVVVVAAVGTASAEQGSVRGVVTSVAAAQGDDGRTFYTVTLKGEGPWQAVLTVGPENKAACELVAALKPGERVAVGWLTEGGKTLVREIVRDTRTETGRTHTEGEGTRPRGEGERVEPKPPVQGDAGQGEVRRDGEGDREAAEREARAKAERERAYKEERDRAYREARARAEGNAGEAPKETVNREAADQEARMRAYKEARAQAEVERKEGMVPGASKTLARVVSIETGAENARVIKLAAVESGEEMTFTVGPDRREVYGNVGNLKAGATVRVYWKTEGGKPVLINVSSAITER